MEPKEILARLAESGLPPDGKSALRISVGLGNYHLHLTHDTLPFIAAGGAELQFLYAPYGRGKTHLLRVLQHISHEEGFSTSYVDCQSHTPFASLQDTYRAIATNIAPAGSNTNPRGLDGLLRDAVGPNMMPERILSSIKNDAHLAADFRNLLLAYVRTYCSDPRPDSLQDLRALLRADISHGVRVSDLYRSNPSFPRPLGKLMTNNSASWLRSLASLPRTLGHRGLVILFDETEQLHSRPSFGHRAQIQHYVNLRNLVDHVAAGSFRGCAIYFAVVEDFLESAKRELEALSQRIERIRLGNGSACKNPRACWVSLDEITDPSPENPMFYTALAHEMICLGVEAGLTTSAKARVAKKLEWQSAQFGKSINMGAVRLFVKTAAALVAQEVLRHD